VAFPCTLVLAAVAHEGGHLLAGRVVGLRPLLARVGPITFRRFGRGWRAGWDWKAGWLGGLAVCDLRGASRWRLLLFLAGGPLGGLVRVPCGRRTAWSGVPKDAGPSATPRPTHLLRRLRALAALPLLLRLHLGPVGVVVQVRRRRCRILGDLPVRVVVLHVR